MSQGESTSDLSEASTPARPGPMRAEPQVKAVDPGEPVLRTKGLLGLAVTALLVIVMAGLHAASNTVAQTLLGLVLAVAVTPVQGLARRMGLSDILGAILASFTLLILAGAFGVLVGLAGSQLARELTRFRAGFGAAQENLRQTLVDNDLEVLIPLVQNSVDLSRIDVLSPLIDAALSVGSVGFVLFVALFTLFEVPTFEHKWRLVTSADPREQANAGRVLRDVQKYLLVKTATCMATGILVGLWTWAMGLEGAVLWGILAFALNYIPFIGALLAGIPPTLVALVGADLVTAVGVATGILIANFIIGNLVEPRVMGRAMGLSPLIVLLSVAVWGWVLGPVGALLSVPLTVIVKLALERSDRYEWVAILLDSPTNVRDPS